jgi:hypothetical protein
VEAKRDNRSATIVLYEEKQGYRFYETFSKFTGLRLRY